jgi:hypothetical protein
MKPTDELAVMHVESNAKGSVTVTVTSHGAVALCQAFEKWLQGHEDFAVDPECSGISRRNLKALDRSSLDIWFWGPRYASP